MFPPCIGNEDLTKIIARHIFDDTFYSVGIEFVEDIIQQKEGDTLVAPILLEEVLRQLHGYEVGLLLSLRGFTFHRKTV